ncbi:Zinc-regulated outer membrane receptor [Polaromonas sp. CG9_12]|nr:Zinc-regulated outer membrane receptor [Polaromonas sp. CG9_12]
MRALGTAAALQEITITGNPLGATDLIAPAAQYSGAELLLRSKTTLGETLDGVPGVSSTYFGPNASWPIIRGLDGDRIRILGNGGATLDASSLSHDHAVTADPGTVFKNKGSDFRLEARHARLGGLEGVVGFQAENNGFSADGAEAFAPYSRTSQKAVFACEEYRASWGKLSFGGRLESVKVESLGNPLVARFALATRDFTPHSYALGALWSTAPGWQVTTNLACTERAPKDYGLFAQGPHIATHAWENGNSALGKEKSTSLDVGTSWTSGANSLAVNAYMHRFKNYIGLLGTGNAYGQESGGFQPALVCPGEQPDGPAGLQRDVGPADHRLFQSALAGSQPEAGAAAGFLSAQFRPKRLNPPGRMRRGENSNWPTVDALGAIPASAARVGTEVAVKLPAVTNPSYFGLDFLRVFHAVQQVVAA